MDYTPNFVRNSSADFGDMLVIPNPFRNYINNSTAIENTNTGREAFCFHGDLYYDEDSFICKTCNCYLERHDTYHVRLRHVCIGERITMVLMFITITSITIITLCRYNVNAPEQQD